MAFPSPALFAPFPPQINYQRAQVPAEGSTSRGTMKKLLIGSQAAAARSRPNGDCAVTAGCSRPPGPSAARALLGAPAGSQAQLGHLLTSRQHLGLERNAMPTTQTGTLSPAWGGSGAQPLDSPIWGDTQL